MDIDDLKSDAAKIIIQELNELILKIKDKNLKISSWYGCFDLPNDTSSFEWLNRGINYKPIESAADDKNFPWFLYWEIIWVTINAEFKPHQKVLDLGGSSSLFSYYLASKGLDVTTVDLQKSLVENANNVALSMGWNLKNYVMDMRSLSFDHQFDHITSICVYEHIPMYIRVNINRHIKELLVPGGRLTITFDYKNPSRFANINSPDDIYNQFIRPSGLRTRGNAIFQDTGKNYLLQPFYHPSMNFIYKIRQVRHHHFFLRDLFKTKKSNDYTFGALFLENA